MMMRRVAYFSMEIALDPAMPTFSGGLGVLAGDTIRAAADMRVPMVVVSLVHRKGYFVQRIDEKGRQNESPAEWVLEDFLAEQPHRVAIQIEGREVNIRAWKRNVVGLGGFVVPVFLLDTDVPGNSTWDRTLTNHLYGGDERYRLGQEMVLGMGGVRMLAALGYDGLRKYHMNEGHASLLTIELLDRQAANAGRQQPTAEDMDAVRKQCVFTTHTPVPAGHDRFGKDLALRMLGRPSLAGLRGIFGDDGSLNLTMLALNLSHYVNGVAKRHGEVSREMFSGFTVDAITNGVHVPTWTAPAFAALFDRYIPGWRADNFSLRSALEIPAGEIWSAHMEQKKALFKVIHQVTGATLKPDVLTLGFARRMTAYKRPDLLIRDTARLRQIVAHAGPLQIVFAGKSHPQDGAGKEQIEHILRTRNELSGSVDIVFLPNYGLELGLLITAGVDIWLNNPEPPLEASGTSGMKAALNGVPSFSTLDGWWLEGCIEGVTGWSIGIDQYPKVVHDQGASHSAALLEKLEKSIMPLFYERRTAFIDMMRYAIALNGSFFNTQRMVQEYVVKAYFTESAIDTEGTE
ncbi:MAG: alpha-glucan family phosphorylase, partial [Burkholderiales bacterium]|nr:alpha-glucan family phosphorylase [Burkholderiales bacterium]